MLPSALIYIFFFQKLAASDPPSVGRAKIVFKIGAAAGIRGKPLFYGEVHVCIFAVICAPNFIACLALPKNVVKCDGRNGAFFLKKIDFFLIIVLVSTLSFEPTV